MSQDRMNEEWERGGLTRVEVVVLLCLTALFAACLGPAFQSSKTRPRKLECLNNIRQIGVAMQNFASAYHGQLPSLAGDMSFKNRDSKSGTLSVGWPIQIMPAMDGSTVVKTIKGNAVAVSEKTSEATFRMSDGERVYFRGFTCHADPDSHQKPGGLSYVVNAGFLSRSLYHGDPDGLHRLGQLSWDGNDVADEETDKEVAAASGVFWRESQGVQSSLDYVGAGDGTTNTLLLSENLQAGSWWDTDTTHLAFGLPVSTVRGRVPFGRGTFFESAEHPLNTQFEGGTLSTATPQDWLINSDLKAAIGTRPRPSSNHEGGVNVIFCDGSGKFLSNGIDPHIYAKLLTPNGVKYGEGDVPSQY